MKDTKGNKRTQTENQKKQKETKGHQRKTKGNQRKPKETKGNLMKLKETKGFRVFSPNDTAGSPPETETVGGGREPLGGGPEFQVSKEKSLQTDR